MKTRIFLILCLFLSIALTEASAQNGTIYHSYPTKVNEGYGCLWVTCDGVNVDFIEYQWDGMDILHAHKAKTWKFNEIYHWKFTSATTGEEFRVKESTNYDVTYDSEWNFMTADGIDRAILVGDGGSRYKLTLLIHATPDFFTYEFVDIRCF